MFVPFRLPSDPPRSWWKGRWKTFCPTWASGPTGRSWPFVLPNRMRAVIRGGPRLKYPVLLLIEDYPCCEKRREEQAVCQNLLICCLIGKCGRNYFTLILDPETGAKISQEYLLCCLICATLYMWTQAGSRSSDLSQERHNSLPVPQNC